MIILDDIMKKCRSWDEKKIMNKTSTVETVR